MESNGHVAVFWDYGARTTAFCASGYDVVTKIRRAVRTYGSITYFKAYLDVPLENTNPRSLYLHSELQASGVTLACCPHSGKKDVADKMMLVDMIAYAIDRPAPATIVLISGDRDFAYGISTLRLRGYDVVVIVPPSTHSSVRSQATFVLNWQTDIMEKRVGSVRMDVAGLDAAHIFPNFGTPKMRRQIAQTESGLRQHCRPACVVCITQTGQHHYHLSHHH